MFDPLEPGICWWCQQDADSREHKHKRSDLVREFGRGPYAEGNQVVRGRLSKLHDIRGPNSAVAKFERTLCSRCNNARSQPFDLAYDRFVTCLREQETDILARRVIDLIRVYGQRWPEQRHAVLRYYVKHAACRLADNGLAAPAAVRNYLDGSDPPDCLRFACEIREDIVAMTEGLRQQQIGKGSLWIGDLWTTKSRSTGAVSSVASFLGYRWFRMDWAIDGEHDRFEGPFETPHVELPSGYSVQPDEIRSRLRE